MDIEKLIEQANRFGMELRRDGGEFEYSIGEKFLNYATALSTLQAENEKLRVLAELGNMRAKDYRVMRDRAVNAEAENEKLRAELERVKVERDAYQVYFKDLSSKPDCNTCEKRNCNYRPKLGATVRVNCPLYSGPQKED